MKKYIKRAFIALSILLLLLVLLAGAVLAWMQTKSGQEFLETTLNRVLVWDEGRVEISGISGSIPFNFQIRSVKVHDRDGAWLEVEESGLNWSLRELLKGRIYIKELGAQALNMERKPHTEPMEKIEVPDDLQEELEWKWPLPALSVENLYLDRARIGEEVMGEEAEFSMQGELLVHEGGFTLAGLDVARLDKDETSLHLAMEFSHNSEELVIHLRFFDSATLPAMLPEENFPGSVEITLDGKGPVKDWPARLKIRGDDLLDLAMDLNLKLLEDRLDLVAGAQVRISPKMAPEALEMYLEHPLHLKTHLDLEYEENLLCLLDLQLDSRQISLNSEAEFALDGMFMQGTAGLTINDLNPLLEPAQISSHEPAKLSVEFRGPVEAPSGDVNLVLGGLHGHDLDLERLQIQADLEYPNETNGTRALARGKINLTGLVYEHYPELPGEMELGFDVDYADNNVLTAKELSLASRDLKALVQGEMDLESMGFYANLEGRFAALGGYLPVQAEDPGLKGALKLRASADGNIADNAYDLELFLSGEEFSSRQELLNVLVGPEPGLFARASISDSLLLKLKELDITTDKARLYSSGEVHLEKQDMDLEVRLGMDSLEFLGQTLNREISGSFSANLSATGPRDEIRLVADAELLGLQPGRDMDIMDIQASLDSVYTPESIAGSLRAGLDSAPGKLEINSDFEFKDNHLKVPYLLASGFDSRLRGELDLDLDTLLAKGLLEIDVPELSSFAELAGLEIYGEVAGSITLDEAQGRQDMTMELQAMDVILENMSLVYLELTGEGSDLFADREYSAQLNLAGLDLGEAYLSSWDMNVQGQELDISLVTSLDGRALYPVELRAEAFYSPEDDTHVFGLDVLEGLYAFEEFALITPFQVTLGEKEKRVSPGELAWGGGRLAFHGGLTPEEVLLEAELRDVLLSRIPLEALEGIEGMLGGKVQVHGDPAGPVASAEVGLSELRSIHPDMEDMPSLDLNTSLVLEGGEMQIEGAFMEGRDRLFGLYLTIPAAFSLDPAAFELDDPVTMQGRLVSALKLEKVSPLFLPPDLNLSGLLQADMDISGRVQEPMLDGKIELDDGIFEHITAGVYLSDISALVRARNEQVVLEELTASDGEAGKIKVQGGMDLDPERHMPWDLDLQIQETNILRHPLAVINVDSCDLELSGDITQASVKGALTFGRIDAQLPKASPPDVVHMDVTEKNKPPSDLPPPPRQVDMEAYPVNLDLELNFPDRVYVRGRGLDSEWGGHLYIDGMAHEPRIRGELSPVRGRFTFLDRRFDLDRESQVYLDGAYPPDPTLDMRAHYRQKDRNITVRVHGRALNPELDLESDPPMHEDEILAWILFGRDLSNLTPFQAITLLNAARTLATGETGPGVMDQLRSLVGVDDIEVFRDDEGEIQFGLGRYVHERVYLQVKKGTAPGSDEVAVEIELSPRISLEGSVESDADGGVFLFWKRDY